MASRRATPYAPRHAGIPLLLRPTLVTAARVFPFAALVTAHDAAPSDAAAIGELASATADAGASPVIVAAPPDVELSGAARVVRTRRPGTPIAAVRLGMAQLTNSVAVAALIVPHATTARSLLALLALVDAAKRQPNAIVAIDGCPLDESPIVVPRDAWLELVTLGEQGLEVVAARRSLVRVRPGG